MDVPNTDFTLAGTLEEVKAKGRIVVHGAHRPRHILIAVARYLAAHSPTERAALQTADIARRLMRGGELHQSGEAS